MEKEICHICGKEKKPYIVVMNNDLFSFLQYEEARSDGPICERCNKFYALTGELKDSTKEEFEIAEEAAKFSYLMLKWWEKDGKIIDGENLRDWNGTKGIAKWCREELSNG